ncbi:MAG TPA: FtsQ-type POTRA domain-containing protein, partial [Candidatus Saccharimonadales bacterium]|nr:FtsQ-type POTRA domain-containing protein [Candidatus Saccharimonadales bacterium]
RRTRAALRFSFWLFVCLAGGAALFAAAAGGWSYLSDPGRFPLESVVVEGAPPPVKEEIVTSLNPLFGRNLFSLDLRALELRVRSHPWVLSASVHRRLPDSLLVVVTPRRVEAFYEIGGQIRMVGTDGRDLGPYEPRWAGEDQPVITGLEAPTRAEVAARLDRALRALRELREGHPGFVESLSALDVSRDDRLTATLRGFGPPVWLHPKAPARNLDRLGTVRARLASEGIGVAYLDLRFRDRIAALPVIDGGSKGAS